MNNTALKVSSWTIIGMIVLALLGVPAAEAFLVPGLISYAASLPGLLGWRL